MLHTPVLLQEMLESLEVKKGKSYLDCTFGAGGYSEEILKNGGIVYACDQDLSTKEHFDKLNIEFPNQIFFYHSNFSNIDKLLKQDNIEKLNGIVMDLGVSSMQIDNDYRGFSFQKDGPLDMRMNREYEKTAEHFINHSSAEDIADVIYHYGDEKDAKRIARAIVKFRETQRITTTIQLADVVKSVIKSTFRQKIHPATKTFQAIRIFINDEMNNLITSMQKLCTMIEISGKMVIVSFHSIEDGVVKRFFQNVSQKQMDKSYKLLKEDFYSQYDFEVNRKTISPTNEEIEKNIRSRSAKMRTLRRIG